TGGTPIPQTCGSYLILIPYIVRQGLVALLDRESYQFRQSGRNELKSLLQKSGVKSNQAATNNSRNFHFFDPPVNSQQSTVISH
ncbi:hypothetical protein, partial [Microcoleus sp. OTE_8_concoct_300]|uniref:hypothetical protein n=1 Tax=Microcoleus sp. OTE_8_concoct_300 TaxID=2964710 RepID=UPI00403FBF6C